MNTIAITKTVVPALIIASLFVGMTASAAVGDGAMMKDKAAKKEVNLTCMQTAVGVRETAVAAAFTGFNTDVQAALTARKAALHDAWGLSDKVARQKAVKSAWISWKSASKAAHMKLKTARKAAWSTFKTTAKTSCKEVLPKEEGEGKDAAGTVSL
jgi:hypothetical protein